MEATMLIIVSLLIVGVYIGNQRIGTGTGLR